APFLACEQAQACVDARVNEETSRAPTKCLHRWARPIERQVENRQVTTDHLAPVPEETLTIMAAEHLVLPAHVVAVLDSERPGRCAVRVVRSKLFQDDDSRPHVEDHVVGRDDEIICILCSEESHAKDGATL